MSIQVGETTPNSLSFSSHQFFFSLSPTNFSPPHTQNDTQSAFGDAQTRRTGGTPWTDKELGCLAGAEMRLRSDKEKQRERERERETETKNKETEREREKDTYQVVDTITIFLQIEFKNKDTFYLFV